LQCRDGSRGFYRRGTQGDRMPDCLSASPDPAMPCRGSLVCTVQAETPIMPSTDWSRGDRQVFKMRAPTAAVRAGMSACPSLRTASRAAVSGNWGRTTTCCAVTLTPALSLRGRGRIRIGSNWNGTEAAGVGGAAQRLSGNSHHMALSCLVCSRPLSPRERGVFGEALRQSNAWLYASCFVLSQPSSLRFRGVLGG
jgi:hypothetical protein